MSDPDRSEDDDVGGGGGPRRPINWDAVAAIVAALVGLLAIVVSAYTAWNTRQQTRAQRQQVRAQVWAHLTVGAYGFLPTYMVKNGASPSDGGSLIASNDGVGPAIVRRVEVMVNGKPEPDWPHLLKALGYPHGQPGPTSILDGRVLSPGQKIYSIAIAGRKDWLRFKRKVSREVVIRTCYCSTLGDCWINKMKHSVPLNKRTRSVDSCAMIPKEDEFKG